MTACAAGDIAIIGGGLAGCECAFRLAAAGLGCTLFEMKPGRFSPAHGSADLAELVCSNSLRSNDPQSAIGELKEELRALGSLCLEAADACRVPAGKALAVDRHKFSRYITARLESEALIRVERRELRGLDRESEPALRGFSLVVLAAGPLPGEDISAALAGLIGRESLYFYDAIAPIVYGESLDMEHIFSASRYGEGDDYLNCPMSREEYMVFYRALLEAERSRPHALEEEKHFEGCLPLETLAERGEKTLLFGPLKPVGLIDPRSGRRPFALLQLRAEDLNREMFNLVGCQTKMPQREQERVFRLVPGLGRARFARYGSMHRNTYVNAPRVLEPDLSLRLSAEPAPGQPRVFLAGQITGVEGYVESAACGLWLGLSLAARLRGRALALPPPESVLGGLLAHLRAPCKNFQPSNAQYGLTPELGAAPAEIKAYGRKFLYAERARRAFARWRAELES